MKPLKTLILAAGVFATSVLLTSTTNAQTPKLNDAEIAHIAVTANQIDVNYGKIAESKTKDASVLKFAKTMVNDHSATITAASKLATKLKVTPQDNAVSKSLVDQANKTKKELKGKSGKAFNKAYIDNEVAYHTAVISAVETLLIPQTQNAELKALLESAVPIFKAHLQHAIMLQKSYK